MLLQVGFFVDRYHLAEQDQKAQEDLRDADSRFRAWLRKYADVVGQGNADHGWAAEQVPDLVNLSSGAQIQTLLFGGFQSSKDVLKVPTKPEAEAGMKPHNMKPQLATVRSLANITAWKTFNVCQLLNRAHVGCRHANSPQRTQSMGRKVRRGSYPSSSHACSEYKEPRSRETASPC